MHRLTHPMRLRATGLLLLGLAVPGWSGEPGSVTCGAKGVEATVTLAYEARVVGDVTGAFLLLGYDPPLGIPGSATDESARERTRSLRGPAVRLTAVDEDSDGDGREDRVRILLTATEGGLRGGEVARVRFDCPAGTRLPASALRCSTDQISDEAGNLLRPEQARLVTCSAAMP